MRILGRGKYSLTRLWLWFVVLLCRPHTGFPFSHVIKSMMQATQRPGQCCDGRYLPLSLSATVNKPLHFWVKRALALISSSRNSLPPPTPEGRSLVPKLLSCAGSPRSRRRVVKSLSLEAAFSRSLTPHESTSFEVTGRVVAL